MQHFDYTVRITYKKQYILNLYSTNKIRSVPQVGVFLLVTGVFPLV